MSNPYFWPQPYPPSDANIELVFDDPVLQKLVAGGLSDDARSWLSALNPRCDALSVLHFASKSDDAAIWQFLAASLARLIRAELAFAHAVKATNPTGTPE
jgi:hypothetical protein